MAEQNSNSNFRMSKSPYSFLMATMGGVSDTIDKVVSFDRKRRAENLATEQWELEKKENTDQADMLKKYLDSFDQSIKNRNISEANTLAAYNKRTDTLAANAAAKIKADELATKNAAALLANGNDDSFKYTSLVPLDLFIGGTGGQGQYDPTYSHFVNPIRKTGFDDTVAALAGLPEKFSNLFTKQPTTKSINNARENTVLGILKGRGIDNPTQLQIDTELFYLDKELSQSSWDRLN